MRVDQIAQSSNLKHCGNRPWPLSRSISQLFFLRATLGRGMMPAMPFSDFDRYRHSLDADVVLSRIDLFEDLAQLHAEADCDAERQRFATQYRALLGFHPDQREQVRESLQHVHHEGNRPVQDLLSDFARQSENLYPPPSGSAASGL
jgi:hypothetical protein